MNYKSISSKTFKTGIPDPVFLVKSTVAISDSILFLTFRQYS